MVAWIVLLVLLIGEAGGFAWWLRKEYYPVFFNGWAALIYVTLLAVDFFGAWLVSQVVEPGGSVALAALSVLGFVLVVATLGMTLFFKWVVGHDMT